MEPQEPTTTNPTTPNPTPAVATTNEHVRLSQAEYATLIAAKTQHELLTEQRLAEATKAENDRLKMQAEKGQADEVIRTLREQSANEIKARDERYATLQAKLIAKGRDAVVADALAGVSFASQDAARQAQELLRSRLTASLGDDGEPIVLEATTRRQAAEWIKEQLASPAYAHFLAPSRQPGAGANRGPLTPPNPQAEPSSLGEMMVLSMQSKTNQGSPQGFGLAGRFNRN